MDREDKALVAGCVTLCALTLLVLAVSVVVGALVGWPYGVALFCAAQGVYWLLVAVRAARQAKEED